MFICIAANQTLFITAAVKCFGSKHKSINYGCIIFSTVSFYVQIVWNSISEETFSKTVLNIKKNSDSL